MGPSKFEFQKRLRLRTSERAQHQQQTTLAWACKQRKPPCKKVHNIDPLVDYYLP